MQQQQQPAAPLLSGVEHGDTFFVAPRTSQTSDFEVSPATRRRRDDEGLAYTLDHTEYAVDFSDIQCEPAQLWLATFIGSGIGLYMIYECLHLYAGPAKPVTFLVPFFGVCAQLITGVVLTALNGTWPTKGQWTRRMVLFVVLSSLGNGAAQALDYVAIVQAGVQLYTILHSSVTFFVALFAVVFLHQHLSAVQWLAVSAVVAGLVLAGIPTPVPAQGSFGAGLLCAALGSLCLAASYPLAELVFRTRHCGSSRPSEEFCSAVGSLVNVCGFGAWTLLYTRPRWHDLVLAPIADAPFPAPSPVVCLLYASHALLVGVHTLAFWKTVRSLGTVAAAVSKGAQQAGTYLLAHIFFCHLDEYECLTSSGSHHPPHPPHGPPPPPPPPGQPTTWSRMQKSVAFACCLLGCVVYAVVKRRPVRNQTRAAGGDAAADSGSGSGTSTFQVHVQDHAALPGLPVGNAGLVGRTAQIKPLSEASGTVRFGVVSEAVGRD
jgi:uncharacterized membrane protein